MRGSLGLLSVKGEAEEDYIRLRFRGFFVILSFFLYLFFNLITTTTIIINVPQDKNKTTGVKETMWATVTCMEARRGGKSGQEGHPKCEYPATWRRPSVATNKWNLRFE